MTDEEQMQIEMGPEGKLAKVTAIDGDRVYIEYRSGTTAWFDQSQIILQRGDILSLSTGEYSTSVTKIPTEAWPDNLWIGIVKLKLDDITILEVDARFRKVPTNTSIEYKVDDTCGSMRFTRSGSSPL